mmetsp:Transcript_41298/g.131339  ORF Transcript_41298/g.131339 Transcript_41298/m.131339 type:complete len:269 (-) Transcript_41298:471-1277(-)
MGRRNCESKRPTMQRRSLAAVFPSAMSRVSQAAQSSVTEMGVRTMAAGGCGRPESMSQPRKRQPQATAKASSAPPGGRTRKCMTSAAAAEAQCRGPSFARTSEARATISSGAERGTPFGGRSSKSTRGTTSASAASRTAFPGALWPQALHCHARGALLPGEAPTALPSGTEAPLLQRSQGSDRQRSGVQQRAQAQRKPRSVSKRARRTSVPIHQRPVSWKYQLPKTSPLRMGRHAVAVMVPVSTSTCTLTFGAQEWFTLQATGARAQS